MIFLEKKTELPWAGKKEKVERWPGCRKFQVPSKAASTNVFCTVYTLSVCMYVLFFFACPIHVHIHKYLLCSVNIVQPPEISEFPDAALMVWPGGRMEIHVVVATTSRITHMTWQHDDDIYTDGINEDPYCSVNSTDLIEVRDVFIM